MRRNSLGYPRQAQLFLSEVCAEGCDYCPYTQVPPGERKKLLAKELSIQEWQQAVEFLYQKLGIKLFFLIGGEPTAKKGIGRLIEFITRKLPGASLVLSTSGISLLKNEKRRRALVKAGADKFAVSIDGINSQSRKSLLGLSFLEKLRRDFPRKDFILSANSILNKKTPPHVLKTYSFLAKRRIYLNLCPEQTLCFGGRQATALDKGDEGELKRVVRDLVKIKRQENNFLIPSVQFLQLLPTQGIRQSFKCSSASFPLTLHLASDGTMPFCIWRRGELANQFNIMELVQGKKTYRQWLETWREDKDGRKCSCSWSFLDRVGSFGEGPGQRNFWFDFT
jgi:sulfatase maturation enzyme AslB (radical SAM superfamily)